MKDYKACGYYLYVKLIKVDDEIVSQGGIVIAGNTKREQKGKTYAEIMSIGGYCWSEYEGWCQGTNPKVGDIVNIAQYGGQDCEIPDDITQEEKQELSLWKLIRDTDVLGVKNA